MWNELVRGECWDGFSDTCRCMRCQDCDEAYDLIDALLVNTIRLEHLVADTRDEVNSLIPHGEPPHYYMTYEDVSDGAFFSHPAMERYIKYYGKYACKPWVNPKLNKRAVCEVSTTGRRRKEVKSIIKNLKCIRDAESVYLSRIPENFQCGEAYACAEENIECLESAIDSLESAY